MDFISESESFSDAPLSEAEARKLLEEARVSVINDFRKANQDVGRTKPLELTSPMNIRWDLSGLTSPIEVETNVLGLLFLEFFSIKHLEQWDIGTAEVLEDLRKGTCVIIGQELGWIADHFSAMTKHFRTMTPVNNFESIQIMSVLMQDFYISELYFSMPRAVRAHVFNAIDIEVREMAQSIVEEVVLPGILKGA